MAQPLSWRKAEEMKGAKVSVGGVLFVMVTTLFFDTAGAFTSHVPIINEGAVGQAEAEALLTFRIEEVVECQLPSRCPADPKMVSDERKLDPQLPAFNKNNNLAPLNPKGTREIRIHYADEPLMFMRETRRKT